VIRRGLLCVVLVCCLGSLAAAQYGGRGPRVAPRYPTAETFGRGFVFCRGIYTSGRREAGGSGWSTDYPDAERNFMIRLSELTRTRVRFRPGGEPEFVTVPLTHGALAQCPYLHMEDVGTAFFSEADVQALRSYLLKGGFIWVDDYWGPEAWENWVSQISQVLPVHEFPIVELPQDHALFRSQFEVAALPQIPSIQFWRTSGGATSERDIESEVPTVSAISDRHGRIMVLMTHNTDISDAWEREGEDPRFFNSFSPIGYAFGINAALYAMTH
jgi:hypothetical protein